jgi:DNA topoisomerase-3
MTKTIFLVAEKPSVASDLCRALTSGTRRDVVHEGVHYIFGHALGHLMSLVAPHVYDPAMKSFSMHTLPFPVPKGWDFKYEVNEASKTVYAAIRAVMKDLPPGSEIVNCCDAGREGELIFRSIFDFMPGVARSGYVWSRLWAQTQTVEGLRQAFAERMPLEDYDSLGAAAYARQHADWYLGLCVSRLATIGAPRGAFPERKVKRCGRVKSPVLGFIVERDRVIENFKPESIYSVRGYFPSISGRKKPYVSADLTPFVGQIDKLGVSKIDPADKAKVFWDISKASAFSKACGEGGSRFLVKDSVKDEVKKPPLGYDLTSIQRDAANRFGLSAKETLKVLQELYETRKVLTYPRTDFKHFPSDYGPTLAVSLRRAVEALDNSSWNAHVLKDDVILRSKVFDSSKVGDHFALAPTGNASAIAELSGIGLDLFRMVVLRCLQAVDESAIYSVTKRSWVKDPVSTVYVPILFAAASKVLKFAGWTRWQGEVVEDADEDVSAFGPALNFENGSKFEVFESKTTPPKHFDDATLLTAMETAGRRVTCNVFDEGVSDEDLGSYMKEKGLGTPATRGDCIEELIVDEYIARVKKGKSKVLLAQPRGCQLYDELMARCSFMVSPAVTAEWEKFLHEIEVEAPGCLDRFQVLDKVKAAVQRAKDGFVAFGLPAGVQANGPEVSSFVCPKSGSSVMDYGAYWVFPGWPDLKCRKVMLERPVSESEWASILKGIDSGKPVKLTGLISPKTKNAFDALIVKTIDKKYGPGFGFEFEQKAPKVSQASGFMCPKSGEPVRDFGAYWQFPHKPWSIFRCNKVFVGRPMTESDWVAVLEGIDKKTPHRLEGLVGKSGNAFSAWIVRKDDKTYGPGFGFDFNFGK